MFRCSNVDKRWLSGIRGTTSNFWSTLKAKRVNLKSFLSRFNRKVRVKESFKLDIKLRTLDDKSRNSLAKNEKQAEILADRTGEHGAINWLITAGVLTERYNKQQYFLEPCNFSSDLVQPWFYLHIYSSGLLQADMFYINLYTFDSQEKHNNNNNQITKLTNNPHDFNAQINKKLKPRPNDRNMPTQHIATLLGPICCPRLATMLRRVATCWVLLAQIWPSSNLSQQHPTCRNTTQHGGQTRATCCAQQCCDMLRWHVAIVWPGL